MKKPSDSILSHLTPGLRIFLFAMILANLGGSMFFSFYALFLKELGFGIETIGLYFTLAAVFPLIFQVFGGWVSDRIGRLRSIAIGSAAGAVSWVGLLLAPFMGHPLLWFLASDALGAVTRALVAPSYDAFIAEQSDEKDRGRVFGLTQSIFTVVGILGPPLGGIVLERLSFSILMWISAGLYWAATIIRVGMARSLSSASLKLGRGEALKDFWKGIRSVFGLMAGGGILLWIFTVDGILDISSKLSSDLLPLYLKEIGSQSESRIGLLQGAMAVATALAMIPFGSWADKKGEALPAALGCILFSCAAGLFSLAKSFELFLVAFGLFGLGMAAFQPAMQSLISKVVPSSLRGIAFGLLGTSLGVFSLWAPAAGAFLWKRFFPSLPFVIESVALLGAAAIAYARFRPLKGEAAVASADRG